MHSVIVDIYIPADDYVSLYRGHVRDAVVTARDGRVIRFPAAILQPFVTREGVRGSFIIEFDDAKKFSSIRRHSVTA